MKTLKNILKVTTGVVITALAMNANALNSNDDWQNGKNPDGKNGMQKASEWVQTWEEQPMGISDVRKDDYLLSVYPVPAKDNLNVDLIICSNAANAEIFNMTGKKVISEQFHNTSADKKINISELADGIYILRITDSCKIINKKFVVKN